MSVQTICTSYGIVTQFFSHCKGFFCDFPDFLFLCDALSAQMLDMQRQQQRRMPKLRDLPCDIGLVVGELPGELRGDFIDGFPVLDEFHPAEDNHAAKTQSPSLQCMIGVAAFRAVGSVCIDLSGTLADA